MAATNDAERKQTRCRLKAKAWALLAMFRKPVGRSVSARAHDGAHRVIITVEPADSPIATPPAAHGGLFLSPLEAAIVGAIGADGYFIAKKIAALTSQRYTGKLKTLLNNLVDREILEKGDGGQGYRWHPHFKRSRRGGPS